MPQKFDLPIRAGKVLDLSTRQIVQHPHVVAATHQFVPRVRPDESRASGYQIAHPLAPLQELFGSRQKLMAGNPGPETRDDFNSVRNRWRDLTGFLAAFFVPFNIACPADDVMISGLAGPKGQRRPGFTAPTRSNGSRKNNTGTIYPRRRGDRGDFGVRFRNSCTEIQTNQTSPESAGGCGARHGPCAVSRG